jgi:hypothetical protein
MSTPIERILLYHDLKIGRATEYLTKWTERLAEGESILRMLDRNTREPHRVYHEGRVAQARHQLDVATRTVRGATAERALVVQFIDGLEPTSEMLEVNNGRH